LNREIFLRNNTTEEEKENNGVVNSTKKRFSLGNSKVINSLLNSEIASKSIFQTNTKRKFGEINSFNPLITINNSSNNSQINNNNIIEMNHLNSSGFVKGNNNEQYNNNNDKINIDFIHKKRKPVDYNGDPNGGVDNDNDNTY
jgi:hypothetical protein